MLNQVKHSFHNVGDSAGDLARRFGLASADFAKVVGNNTAHLARRVSDRTTELAHEVGPKRGLIGLAIVAVAVGGGVLLARYLRQRAEAREHEDESIEMSEGVMPRRRRGRNADRRSPNAMSH